MVSATSPFARRHRLRSYLAVVVAMLVAAMGVISVPAAAHAAPGDFTVTLGAPETVQVGGSYNYEATVEFEGVDASNPATGVQLVTTLPVGTRLESIPTGASSPVESYTYDPATRVLTIVLKDTTESLLAIVYTVAQTERANKYEGMELTSSITGVGGPSGDTVSNTVTTVVEGDNNYAAEKRAEVVTGGDNRTVTYRFNVRTTNANSGTTFTSWMQKLTDTFPAGAELVAASPAFGGGAWDTTTWPTATWTRDGQYGPDGSGLDSGGNSIWLTVYYPETVEGWETGSRPTVNTVELETSDIVDVVHAGSPANAQGPAFAPGGGTDVVASKTEAGPTSAGMLAHVTTVGGSYVGDSDAADISELVITDSGAAGEPNASWFRHTDIQSLRLNFSSALAAANLPYSLEYQIDGSSTWTEFEFTAGPALTGTPKGVAVQNVGSQGWQNPNYDVINLPVGSTLSGWRLTIAPGAETVPVGSEAKVLMAFQPVFRDVANGVQPSSAPAGVSPGPQTNTVTVSGDDFSSDASSTITPEDSVYVTTNVGVPSALSVGGGSGLVTAGIVNQNPSETYTDSALTVVLPCGVVYDSTQQIVPVDSTYPGVPATPALGAGATLDDTGRVTDAEGCERQVIEFSFDELPPMRAAGTANHRYTENSGWKYQIPVVALAQAYDPEDTSVPTYSYSTVADPRFISVADGGSAPATVPMTGYGPFFGDDTYDFDPARATVGVASARTSINTAGGLLISKLSGASAQGPWSLDTVVGETSFWQIFVSDVLPNPVSNIAFFDKLPSVADGDEFDTELAAAVTGAPAGATVEYSVNATTASDGEWTTTAAGATAFRVSVPSMTSGDDFTLVVPVTNLGDLEYGQQATNTVSAAGTYNGSPVAFESNEAAVSVLAAPSLALVKTTNGVEYANAPGALVATGSPVIWAYEVTNTGDTTLDDVAVGDAFVDGSGEAGTFVPTSTETGPLLPGETRTFTATGTAQAGQYHNTATATAVAVDGETVLDTQPEPAIDESWYLAGDAGLTIVKTTNGVDVTSAPGLPLVPGSAVEWAYTVTNTGTLPLTDVLVEDVDSAGDVVFSEVVASLEPGASVTLTASGVAIAGQYHNTVAASAADPAGGEQPLTAADDSWYFGDVPGLSIEKQVSDALDGPWTEDVTVEKGGASYWKVTVTNTGNSALSDVVLSDPKLDQTVEIGSLEAGETWTTTLTHAKTVEGFTNVATATGTSVSGELLEASDDALVQVGEPSAPGEEAPSGEVVPPGATPPGGLPVTGFALTSTVLLAGMLLLGGALLIMRRRSTRVS